MYFTAALLPHPAFPNTAVVLIKVLKFILYNNERLVAIVLAMVSLLTNELI